MCISSFSPCGIGARLRRALRHNDPQARTAAIAEVLRNVETWVRALMRRVKHGLTRRAPKFRLRCAESCTALALSAGARADTS